jgi:hypothetical protein
MEGLVTRMIDAAHEENMSEMIAAASIFIHQISKHGQPIPLTMTPESEIAELADEVNLLYDSLSADIKAIRRKVDGPLQPQMLLDLIGAYNLRPVGVVDRDGFSTEVFSATGLVNHILINRDNIDVEVKDGVLDVTVTEPIKTYTVSSALLATLYITLFLRANVLAGVVHTPNIGLLYAFDASALPRGVGEHPYSTVPNIVRRPSPPFPEFDQKLKPCSCAKHKCTCVASKDKHIYIDILTRRVGFLPRVPDATGAYRIPVPFYSYPAMALRLLAENLYSEDLHKDGHRVLNLAIKKFEDTIRADMAEKPDVDANGRTLVPDSDDELELSRV